MRTLLFIGLILLSNFSFAQSSQQRQKHYNTNKGLALDGYDPVAYFKNNKAIRGKKTISLTYSGITYYFSSEVNRKLFQENPKNYEPCYGGWCAFAMGDYGKKVEVDPETFKIVDGKLYLFYNAFLTNTLLSWNKNEQNLRTNADKNWGRFIQN